MCHEINSDRSPTRADSSPSYLPYPHNASATATPRISVVIPAYNAERYLARCLASVFSQTLMPEEVIVVDDGSLDNTAALARDLGALVICRPNGGLSAARNTGIRIACGEWIALLDADDRWAFEKLERQALSIRPDTVLVYTGIQDFDDKGLRACHPGIDSFIAKQMLRYRNPIVPSSVLVRRDAVMRNGGFREDICACEDWEMWVRLQREGAFVCVPDPLTDYYLHSTSLSADPERMLQALKQIMDTTLLAGLSGAQRWAWRHRISAVQLCSAGLIARDNHLPGELGYMFRSVYMWPSPLWEPRRFAALAVSMRTTLFSIEESE